MTDTPAPAAPRVANPIAAVVLAACAIAAPLTMRSEGEVKHGYRDPVGIITDCFGHTGAGAELGKVYTDQECQAQLLTDEGAAGTEIASCIKPAIPLKTRAAFTDFAFNVGTGAFCRSTMAAKVNAGDLPGACAELSKWVYAGGKVLPGLVSRRAAERTLCEAGIAGY